MTLRFGVYVPTTGPAANADALRRTARAAEELGYDGIWSGDHIILPKTIDFTRYLYGEFPVPSDVSSPFYEPVAALAYLAGVTKTIKLGIGILVIPYRNALVLGKQIASLDNLSGGRFILGVGTGWMIEEFEALGLPPDVFTERGAVTDETVDVMKALWAEGPTSFDGRYYKFDGVGAYPKPAQGPGIPIWVGGNSKPAFRRIARIGDAWQALGLDAKGFAEKKAELDELVEAAGRRPEDVIKATAIGVVQTEPGAALPIQPSGGLLVGDAAALAAQLNAFAEAGAQEFTINFSPQSGDEMLAQLESFRPVMDQLR